MEILTKSLQDGRVLIVDIKNVLGIKELPKDYYYHVPYMAWRKYIEEEDAGYLLVNYIGGVEHIMAGQKWPCNVWERIRADISNCEWKLHKINHGMTIICPFCNIPDFNKRSLKWHLLKDCNIFRQNRSIGES